jgi:hypothetical protein
LTTSQLHRDESYLLRGLMERDGAEWVVREEVGAGGEMTQVLYAHMNNNKKKSLRIQ